MTIDTSKEHTTHIQSEWGVIYHRDLQELHVGPMTEAEAKAWVDEWEKDYPYARPRMFQVVYREVSEWKQCGN